MSELVYVAYSANKNVVIDQFDRDGKTYYSMETLEELKSKYPDVVKLEINEAILQMEERIKAPPKKISKRDYYDALYIMPPKHFHQTGAFESFQMIEHISGQMTRIYVRIARAGADCFYSFIGRAGMSQQDIISLFALPAR